MANYNPHSPELLMKLQMVFKQFLVNAKGAQHIKGYKVEYVAGESDVEFHMFSFVVVPNDDLSGFEFNSLLQSCLHFCTCDCVKVVDGFRYRLGDGDDQDAVGLLGGSNQIRIWLRTWSNKE